MKEGYYRHTDNKDFHVWDLEDFDQLNTSLAFKSNSFFKNLKKNDRVLDLGCGPGYNVKTLTDNGIECLGIDLNKESIDIALSKGLPVKRMDALEAIDLYGNKYNIFLMSDFIEHVPLEVVSDLLQKIAAIKGAKVFISTPNLDSLMGFKFWFHMPTHINPMHPFVIKTLLNRLGFTLSKEWSEGGSLPGVGWKLKLRKLLLKHLLGESLANLHYGGGNICFIAQVN